MVRRGISIGVLCLALALPAAQPAAADGFTERPEDKVEVGPTASPVTSIALGSLPVVLQPHPYVDKAKDRQNPLAYEPDQGQRGTWDRTSVPPDPLASQGYDANLLTPPVLFTFAGTGNPLGCGGCAPPDTVGDVGPKHYIQMVNATKVSVYSKTGSLLGGPFDLSDLFTSGACLADSGDPVVAYDPLADRWVLAQFNGANSLCFAVSTTANPLGTYAVYAFSTTDFPDYFKIGVWPDGYYVSTNELNYNAWAFDRVKMLQGIAAGSIKATGFASNFLMPSDVDGIVAPPAGAPAIYYTFLDNSFHGGSDRLELRAFDVDWVTPGNSTFTIVGSPTIASFTYTVCGFFNLNCAPQPGTAQTVDVVSEWPMFRFAYRRFAGYESLVGNFTVPVSGRSAPRWFELRGSGTAWSLFQQGTYDPDATAHRFMGSIAQDRLGSIALGYSAMSGTVSPAIRFATRRVTDAAGTLGSESTLIAGAGSQTGANRWGDYSALSIDPADDCTFWYTNQYYTASSASNWATRIGTFRVAQCKGLFFDNFETGGRTRWSATLP
jgi:hypothetical protein